MTAATYRPDTTLLRTSEVAVTDGVRPLLGHSRRKVNLEMTLHAQRGLGEELR